jgi:hypothetical protein
MHLKPQQFERLLEAEIRAALERLPIAQSVWSGLQVTAIHVKIKPTIGEPIEPATTTKHAATSKLQRLMRALRIACKARDEFIERSWSFELNVENDSVRYDQGLASRINHTKILPRPKKRDGEREE